MSDHRIPQMIQQLLSGNHIDASDILATADGFFLVYKSISDILVEKNILDFPNFQGARRTCNRFFDDWFLYAVPNGAEHTYSLLKLREQEHDAEDGTPGDSDTPGVTISFISFAYQKLLSCLADPTDENRAALNNEINRVVVYKGQCHHNALKQYFKNPQSQGAYLVADVYAKQIASFAENGCLPVPDAYKAIVRRSNSCKKPTKGVRLPAFLATLNQTAGYMVCDNETIRICNREAPTAHEAAAILATHTGNTSRYSFAAEVEYHARFLIPLAKIKIPFLGKSIYDSAIRADMTIDDTEFEGPAPFYKSTSKIVKRQHALHKEEKHYD